MRWREDGNLWLSPPEDIIDIDKDRLLKIIDKSLKRSYLPYFDEDVFSSDVEDELEESLHYNLIDQMKIKYGTDDIIIDNIFNYDHKLSISIRFEVFNKLYDASFYKLQPHELIVLRDFLNAPPGQELQAWEKWEKYWKHREDERAKKNAKIMNNRAIEAIKREIDLLKNSKITLDKLYEHFKPQFTRPHGTATQHIKFFYTQINQDIYETKLQYDQSHLQEQKDNCIKNLIEKMEKRTKEFEELIKTIGSKSN